MEFESPFGLSEALELAGSAAVILVMIGVAAVLGFRMSARMDEGELARLAEAEGASVQNAVIARNGRAALARLSDGRIMVARVMGADISARFAFASSARIRFKSGRLIATFADMGFPPLNIRLDEEPAWLVELSSAGGAP